MQGILDPLQQYQSVSFCNAFHITNSIIATKDEIQLDAKDAFEQIINEVELEVRRKWGELYVGNLHGPGLAGLPEEMQIPEEQYVPMAARETSKDVEIALLQEQVAELNDSVATLKLATLDYK